MLPDLARGRVVPPALDREDEEEALVVGERHVVPPVAGVPLARELERRDAVLEVTLALLEVLRGVDDGVQVGGGPHVLEEDPPVGLDVADDGVGLHHSAVVGEADAGPPLLGCYSVVS